MKMIRLIIHEANKFMRIIKSIKMIKTYEDGRKFMKIIRSIMYKSVELTKTHKINKVSKVDKNS